MRYFNPEHDKLNRRRAFSTLAVVGLALLTCSLASVGVQLTNPIGRLLAITLLGAMVNHVYQWSIAGLRQIDDHRQAEQGSLPQQTRSAA